MRDPDCSYLEIRNRGGKKIPYILMNASSGNNTVKELLPLRGIILHERPQLSEVLCKPKILPLRSKVVERMQELERQRQVEENEKN